MILGDITRFAIQWELDPNQEGKYLLGRICFWVGSIRIGNYEIGTALSDVLVNLAHIIGDCGKRSGDRFCHLSPENAFSLLHKGLFHSDSSLSQIVEDESWARFCVSLPVDIFDNWRLYLVDCESRSRLLVGCMHEESDTFEFLLEKSLLIGEFDRIIIAFQKDLEALWCASPTTNDNPAGGPAG
jgi:hypothetical protein